MGFKREEIRDMTPLSLKKLNDNIRYLWMKTFGSISFGDFDAATKAVIDNKANIPDVVPIVINSPTYTSDMGAKLNTSDVPTVINNNSTQIVSIVTGSTKYTGDINGLDARLDSTELKVTPTAIVSTVRSSTEYTSDLSAKVAKTEFASQITQNASTVVSTVTGSTTYKNDIGGLDTRLDAAELKITSSAIVSTVRSSTEYTNDLGQKITSAQASTISQTPSNVQIGFNGITSNVQNSSGKFSIINGSFNLTGSDGRTGLSIDPSGYIYNEWGLKSALRSGDYVYYANGSTAARGGNDSTLLRAWGLGHESLDDSYKMHIMSKNKIMFTGLDGGAAQDTECGWSYAGQFRTTGSNGNTALRENALDSLSGTLWLNYYGGSNVTVSNGGGSGAYGALYCGDFHAYGAKNSIVKTIAFGDIALSAYETADTYFGDIGEGKLENGECIIYIDEEIKAVMNTDITYQVFISKYGQGDTWVDKKTPDYFVVKGINDINFGWELKAKRRGYEDVRLERISLETENKEYQTEETRNIDSELIATESSQNYEIYKSIEQMNMEETILQNQINKEVLL